MPLILRLIVKNLALMEVGDEHEDVSRTGEAEISENLDATANEGGSGVASEGNECASFDGIQCEVFNVNIGSQSSEAISLNGDEVRKEAGKVVEALIMSFEEDKLEHELASASMRLEQLMPEAEMVIGGEEEGEVLIVEKGISTEWHEDESQNPDNKSVGPNSADMDTQSEEHSTNHLHIEKSVSPALSVLDSEKESLSSLDPDIIHGHDCNEETLPDQFLGVKCDILEALPHLDSRDEMKALVDTVSNMGEKAEAQTDTLIIKGWGEVGDSKGKNENVEALTEEGLYEAGFVTISPLACGLEGSAISADSSGNISEAKQGFSKSAVLAVEPETIGVDLNLRNPVIELSEEENDSQQSDFMESVKAQGVSQLGEAWRPTAAAEEEAGADQQPAAAAALPDSDAHPVHSGQLPAEEHAHAHKCEIDAEREGMVENKDKGGELKEWLLVKEKEFDEILGHGEDNGRSCNMTGTAVGIDCDIPKDGFMKACEIEVMACKMSQSNTQAEAWPGERDISVEGSTFITETTTDLMDELELQSEILRQITEKASVVSADNDIGEKVRGLEEDDGEIQRKKGKTSKAGSKSMKTKKKIPKSPLLKRSEIKACIDLHNACENADILQEIIQPAISFGSTHKALEQEVVCRNKEVESETMSKEEVDEPVFVEEVTWQDPPQPRPRKPVFFAGKPRRQPIRVVGLALNQFSHFSGCHVNVSQDTSCVTAFIHAARAGVLVDYKRLIPTTVNKVLS